MADDSGQEREHQATEKKVRDAAERGQIAKSRELSSAGILAVGAATLVFATGPMRQSFSEAMVYGMNAQGTGPTTIAAAADLGQYCIQLIVWAAAPTMLGLVVIALVIGFSQSQFQMAWKVFEPKWEKLNAIEGIKNQYFSWTPVMELFKGVMKLASLSLVIWIALSDRIAELPLIAMLSPGEQLATLADLGWTVVLYSMPLVLAIAVLDYGYQKWKLGEDLKMSTEELKQERKDTDGDPYVKAQRRQRARQIAMGQMVQAVAEADMVLTNPTHYAVALRYRKDEAPAPQIVAMGIDHMALKIRQVARANDIPCIENRPLARALYAQGKVGFPIPDAFFGPVAQVLAVVYRKRAARKARLANRPR